MAILVGCSDTDEKLYIDFNGIWGAFASEQETRELTCDVAKTVFLFKLNKIYMMHSNQKRPNILAENYEIKDSNGLSINIHNPSINHKSKIQLGLLEKDIIVFEKTFDFDNKAGEYRLTAPEALFLKRC